MIHPKILVTSAAGRTGSVAVLELLKHGYPVRAFVHRDDERAKRLRSAGAEIVAPSYRMFPDSGPLDRIKETLRTYRVQEYQQLAAT